MRRVLVGEMMDDPGVSREELDDSLRYIRSVNLRLGGARALLEHLETWSARWPRDRAVTMLDIGTGSADIPLAARTWARSRGFDLHVTGLDLHATTLDLAREHINGDPGITLVRADALTLDGLFPPASFDYVHAGMFLHHLADAGVERVLSSMDRVCRAGLVWNDLWRSPVTYAITRLLVLGQSRIVAHDATVSVRAGFTGRECRAMIARLDLPYLRYHRSGLWYRFTVAGEKPRAWRDGPKEDPPFTAPRAPETPRRAGAG